MTAIGDLSCCRHTHLEAISLAGGVVARPDGKSRQREVDALLDEVHNVALVPDFGDFAVPLAPLREYDNREQRIENIDLVRHGKI